MSMENKAEAMNGSRVGGILEADDAGIEVLIREDLAGMLSTDSGCSFDRVRVSRIANSAGALLDSGVDAAKAFSRALEEDLLLYGDPLAPVVGILGFGLAK